MKIVVLNNNIVWGGAYRAAINTHKTYLKTGLDSNFLNYLGNNSKIKRINSVSKHYIDRAALRLYKNRIFPTNFSPAKAGINLKKFHQIRDADIINMHWITGGFISLKSLKWLIDLGKPIVWTIHDFWPITGGCHVNGECLKFTQNCGKCPMLGSHKESDLSRKGWTTKKKIYSSDKMHITTVSKWMAKQVKNSSLMKGFNISSIHNPIETDVFKPNNPNLSRKKLNLSKDNFLILFGGMGVNSDPNKGLNKFIEAVNIFADNPDIPQDKIEVLIFGNDALEIDTSRFRFKTNLIGKIEDDKLLASYYSASDVFVCSSEQETGPITVLESMSCGTIVISNPVGEVPETIDHMKDGYVANNSKAEELAKGLEWRYKLTEPEESQITEILRNKILKACSFEVVGNEYKKLFEELLYKP